ncbi:hypothetical protein [Lysobacter capsici]|uniref:hypothetical protein n=1 Tax=Lysobacter capsici TaxID=435897 RepID=UPI00287B5C05|nr:hypothetical protein [Lysobacter capsici]WND78567.1 hypothetical protein RJ610_14740 [Lysobacter capsici]WND83762.1 hypothetical protein RJ609_14750 [Lysobacter capsici]
MDIGWAWLSIAGLGALHGASPANGWMFAAACGVHARDDAQARRAMLPIAIGHAASVAIVVCAVAQGLLMDRAWVQSVAGALLIGVAVHRWLRGAAADTAGAALAGRFRIRTPTGHIGIALWSCLMATAHGAGLMLVPALVPICMSGTPARDITASGSLALGLAAVGLHLAAMLVTTGAIATGVCRGIALHPRWMSGRTPARAWTAVQAVTGVVLMLRAG